MSVVPDEAVRVARFVKQKRHRTIQILKCLKKHHQSEVTSVLAFNRFIDILSYLLLLQAKELQQVRPIQGS